MGNAIVPLEEARGWEGKIFRQVCEQGQREAEAYLGKLEDALFQQRPAGWNAIGFRESVLVTRFGEVRIRRRLKRLLLNILGIYCGCFNNFRALS